MFNETIRTIFDKWYDIFRNIVRNFSRNAFDSTSMFHYSSLLVLILGTFGLVNSSLLPQRVLAQTGSGILFQNGTSTALNMSTFGLVSGGGNRQAMGQISAVPDNSGYVCSIQFALAKSGTPTDAIKLKVWDLGTSSSTDPNPNIGGVFISSSTILGSSITAGATALYNFNFENCWIAVPGKFYNLELTRTGALDNTNNYSVGFISGSNWSKYADGLGGWDFWSPNDDELQMSWFGYYNFQTASFFPTSTLNIPGFTSSTPNCASLYPFTDTYTGINIPFFATSALDRIQCTSQQILESGLRWSFYPQSGLTFFNSQFAEFQNTFPFVIFFQFQNIVQTEIGATPTDQELILPVRFPNATSDIVIFSSSSMENLVGSNAKTIWFDFQKYVAWAIAGVGMVGIMVHKKR